MRAKPGHLSHSMPNLKQTDKVRKQLSQAQQYNEVMKRMQPVNLGWQKGEGK